MHSANYAIVFFPFLRTSRPVKIGDQTFYSTNDLGHLTKSQARDVKNIASMIYLRNNIRIESAVYAIYDELDIHAVTNEPTIKLKRVRDAICYMYAAPHPIFGNIFLSPEYISLFCFAPERILKSFIGGKPISDSLAQNSVKSESNLRVNGFYGLHNFYYHFWTSKGSRIYGQKPFMTLNPNQDLANDIIQFSQEIPSFEILFNLLNITQIDFSERIFSALHWFNSANCESTNENASLLFLAIAFETLLALPKDQKTARIVDAISLILGRVTRLEEWATQFYDARSRIVHQGHTESLRLIIENRERNSRQSVEYSSLIFFGRQIFRMCLYTLLYGENLAKTFGLEARFVTNQERFRNIVAILEDKRTSLNDIIITVNNHIEEISKYKYASQQLHLEILFTAVRSATQRALDENLAFFPSSASEVANILKLNIKISLDIRLRHIFEYRVYIQEKKDEASVFCQLIVRLVDIVWDYIDLDYYASVSR